MAGIQAGVTDWCSAGIVLELDLRWYNTMYCYFGGYFLADFRGKFSILNFLIFPDASARVVLLRLRLTTSTRSNEVNMG